MNKHLLISGRVQGVGFRYSAQQKAKELALVGWVRNNADGKVELKVEGENNQIITYIEALKSGFNQYIRVDHVEEKAVAVNESNGYSNFSIK